MAASACIVLMATAAACGDDDAPEPSASAPVATTAGGGTAAGATVTSPAGETCVVREPDPAPSPEAYPSPPEVTIDTSADYRATLETSCGPIVIALDAAAAPTTVNNFVFLAREGFYDGLTFHRVVSGFVIQGGDPEGTGRGGPGYAIPDELPDDGYAEGDLAMANAGPDTAGSQFFIVTGDASALPNAYTRFGRIVEGLDVARTIEGFADPDADPGDPAAQTPVSPIYIDSVTITGP